MANRVRVPRPTGYTVQLRGKAGTPTAAITLNGTYQATFKAYAFDVLISGLYDLYEDPAGGSAYVQMVDWDDGNSKWVEGSDMVIHKDGHGDATGLIEPGDTTFAKPF